MAEKVYVNLADHLQNGHAVRVTTTKGASKVGTRQSRWTLTGESGNLGNHRGVDGTRFIKDDPVDEELPVGTNRVFENAVVLSPYGGNRYVVEVSKRHAGSTGGRTVKSRTLEAWRKVFFTVNPMAGLEAERDHVVQNLPGVLDAAFVELLARQPAQAVDGVIPQRVHVDKDSISGLPDALADVPWARQPPALGVEERGLWLRIMLVERLVGSKESQTLQRLAGDGVFNDPRWSFRVDAPQNRYFCEPGVVQRFVLRLVSETPLQNDVVRTVAKSRNEGSTRTRLRAATDEVGQGLVDTAANGFGSITLALGLSGGVTVRMEAKTFDDPTLTFEVPTSQTDSLEMNWARRQVLSKSVEIVHGGFELTFDAAGAEAQGRATLTVANDNLSYTIEVTDGPINQQITAAFQQQVGGRAELEVTHVHGMRISGQSTGRNIVIAVGEIDERANLAHVNPLPALVNTITHEVIHSLGGVVAGELNHPHPHYYPQAQGGVATAPKGHCGYGAAPVSANTLQHSTDAQKQKNWEPDKAQIYTPNSSRICVMFHRGYYPHCASARVCKECLRQIRAFDLSSAELKWV